MAVEVSSAPDHWEGEDVIITIEEEGKDVALNFEGTVLKISKSGGEEPTNDVHTFGAKTFSYSSPTGKVTISIDLVIKNADWDRVRWSGDSTASEGITVEQRSDKTRLRKRIIIWFVPKANQQKSGTIVVPPNSGPIYRRMYIDAKAVTFDWDFDSGEYKKGTMSFELSSVDSDGYPNEVSQYTPSQGTTTLAVLNTTAHRGTLTWDSTTPAWTAAYRT